MTVLFQANSFFKMIDACHRLLSMNIYGIYINSCSTIR